MSAAGSARLRASTIAAAPAARLGEQAYDRVKQLIFDFALMPAEPFSEAELAARIEVSRTPLRQALQRLQAEGFVRLVPRSGWQVAPLDFDQFDELYELRELIECNAARQLCKLEHRLALQRLAGCWLVAPSRRLGDPDAVRRLDEAFHSNLVELVDNREIARVHRDISERIRIIRRLDFTSATRIETTYEEHGRILHALIERRADEAQRLLRAHIEQSRLEVRKITLDRLYRLRRDKA